MDNEDAAPVERAPTLSPVGVPSSAPQRITIKRRRSEEPVDTLYLSSKKVRPSTVWKRIDPLERGRLGRRATSPQKKVRPIHEKKHVDRQCAIPQTLLFQSTGVRASISSPTESSVQHHRPVSSATGVQAPRQFHLAGIIPGHVSPHTKPLRRSNKPQARHEQSRSRSRSQNPGGAYIHKSYRRRGDNGTTALPTRGISALLNSPDSSEEQQLKRSRSYRLLHDAVLRSASTASLASLHALPLPATSHVQIRSAEAPLTTSTTSTRPSNTPDSAQSQLRPSIPTPRKRPNVLHPAEQARKQAAKQSLERSQAALHASNDRTTPKRQALPAAWTQTTDQDDLAALLHSIALEELPPSPSTCLPSMKISQPDCLAPLSHIQATKAIKPLKFKPRPRARQRPAELDGGHSSSPHPEYVYDTYILSPTSTGDLLSNEERIGLLVLPVASNAAVQQPPFDLKHSRDTSDPVCIHTNARQLSSTSSIKSTGRHTDTLTNPIPLEKTSRAPEDDETGAQPVPGSQKADSSEGVQIQGQDRHRARAVVEAEPDHAAEEDEDEWTRVIQNTTIPTLSKDGIDAYYAYAGLEGEFMSIDVSVDGQVLADGAAEDGNTLEYGEEDEDAEGYWGNEYPDEDDHGDITDPDADSHSDASSTFSASDEDDG